MVYRAKSRFNMQEEAKRQVSKDKDKRIKQTVVDVDGTNFIIIKSHCIWIILVGQIILRIVAAVLI